MIRIYEEFDRNSISNILKSRGFRQMQSSDSMILKFTKIETGYNSIIVNFDIYMDDVSDKFSIQISSDSVLDFSYLSDYIDSVDQLIEFMNNDYYTVLDQIKSKM